MNIPEDALILVADGEKALFLRQEDDSLVVENKEVHPNPPTREQAANRRGRMFDGTGHKSAVDDTDWHQLEKERFAAEISEMLYGRAHNGDFDRLILVASPGSLGEIRQHLHQEVSEKLVGEIAKDLTNHPIDEIERIIHSA